MASFPYSVPTVAELRAQLELDQAEDVAALAIHDAAVALTREKWQGKKFNRRFIDQLAARMGWPETVVKVWDGSHLTIYGKGCHWSTYNTSRMFYLVTKGRPTNPDYHGHCTDTMHADGMDYGDPTNGSGARERIAQRAALLADPAALQTLADAGQAAREAYLKLEACTDAGQPGEVLRYWLQKRVGVTERRDYR